MADGSVDAFYHYIVGIAADTGYDTSNLPTNPYNVMQVTNAYGVTTTSVGTKNLTTSVANNSGGNYLMVGPGYDTSQALPDGVTSYIQSQTAQSWLIGRMAVDNLATGTLANGNPTPYNIIAGGSSNVLSLNNSAPLAQSYAVTSLANYLAGHERRRHRCEPCGGWNLASDNDQHKRHDVRAAQRRKSIHDYLSSGRPSSSPRVLVHHGL